MKNAAAICDLPMYLPQGEQQGFFLIDHRASNLKRRAGLLPGLLAPNNPGAGAEMPPDALAIELSQTEVRIQKKPYTVFEHPKEHVSA
jgi:hypothetical protein